MGGHLMVEPFQLIVTNNELTHALLFPQKRNIVGSKTGYQKGEDDEGVYITLTEDHWIHQSDDEVSNDSEQLDFVYRNEDHYGGDGGDGRDNCPNDVVNGADIQGKCRNFKDLNLA